MSDAVPDTAGDAFDPRHYEHFCFACGRQNPFGLQLRFERDGDGVRARYMPRAEDCGFPGVFHGGVLVTLLDEAMAWAIYAGAETLGVTAKMETRYRRAARLDEPLTVRAHLTRVRGRRLEVEATLDAPGGERVAEANALFLRLPPERDAEVRSAIGWTAQPPAR